MSPDRRARPVFAGVMETLSVLLLAAEAGELQPLEAVSVYHRD